LLLTKDTFLLEKGLTYWAQFPMIMHQANFVFI
jgi:hypothetical protein